MPLPSIAAYTTTYNCFKMQYPLELCLYSLLGFADEVVVVDAGSTDGTLELLQRFSKEDSRVKFYVEPVDMKHPRWAVQMDGYLKAKSRAKCTAEYCWQTDTDEIVVPHDFDRIRALPDALREVFDAYPVVYLPMVEFWGSFSQIRADFLSWKPRFSKNDKRITHGVPLEYRMVDSDGFEYPKPYESDSCNYIWKDTKESVPMLFPAEVKRLDMSPEEFDRFFYDGLNRLPSVLHISWLDIRRKMWHYKEHWGKFHASMYNLDDPDRPENNHWFEKRWSEVTATDIERKAQELELKGPRFHHSKEHGATVPYRGPLPPELKLWAERESRKNQ